MGMAASQGRYLALTARKSTVEYQAQQINQQRTMIANELSGTFADLVKLEVPTVPSELNYQETLYKYSDTSRTTATDNKYSFSKILSKDGQYSTIRLNLLNTAGGTVSTRDVKADIKYDSISNKINEIIIADSTVNLDSDLQALDIPSAGSSDIQAGSISYTNQTNEEAYQEAMREYTTAKDKYDKCVNEINNKTSDLQRRDSTLELKLRQLDTEQNSIQQELESVKKVIEDTIKTVFTTFQSS